MRENDYLPPDISGPRSPAPVLDDRTDRIDIAPYLEVLNRRKFLILTFCLSAAITSLGLTYVFSEKYRTYTTILYRPQQVTTFQNKQQEALGFPVPLAPIESIVNSLESVAKSTAVAEAIVTKLDLDKPMPKTESNPIRRMITSVKDWTKKNGGKAWQILKYGRIIPEDPLADAIAKLQKDLRINATRRGYTFRLELTDSYPERVAAIVDTAAEVLAELLRGESLRANRNAQEAIEARLKENDIEILETRQSLENFKKTQRISSLSEEISLRLKTISNFEEELNKVKNDLQVEEKRRTELRVQLNNQEVLVKYLSTVSDNPIVQELKTELARQEVQRAGLLEKFQPSHLEVKAVEAKLAEIRDRLSREQEKIVSSESQRLNDVYQKVLTDQLEVESNLQGLAARREALAAEIARMKDSTKNLTDKEATLAQMTLQLDSAERAHRLLNDAIEEARIAESKNVSEIVVLHKAPIPTGPVHPIKILHVGVSTFLGLFLAAACVFFLDYFDPALRSVWQVERVVKLPVLATIPKIEGIKGD